MTDATTRKFDLGMRHGALRICTSQRTLKFGCRGPLATLSEKLDPKPQLLDMLDPPQAISLLPAFLSSHKISPSPEHQHI